MGDNKEVEQKPTYNELVAKLDAELRKNVDLKTKLGTTSELLVRVKATLVEKNEEIASLSEPPEAIGTFVGRSDKERCIIVWRAGQKQRVSVSTSLDIDGLQLGQPVVFNANGAVTEALPFEDHGEIMTVKEVCEDGTRVIVLGHNDNERMVRLTDPLLDRSIKAGSSLMVDPRTGIAYELVSKAEVNDLMLEEVPDISYSDIGGLAAQVDEIRDAVELPRLHPDLYSEHELSAPKGVLLYGPPGCGKTLIAKAIANSLAQKASEKSGHDVKSYFLNIKGPELLDKYVGETERRIRLVFERAREKASAGSPVVIFFDEMDAMFRTRGSGVSSDVENTIVPQLLAEIDGVETLENVLVIGASNRQDMIDPAILRPGRLDIKIKIERPDAAGAADIFAKYLTTSLPLHKLELDEFGGDRAECVKYMIQQTVEHMYATTPEHEFLEVFYKSGTSEILHYKDFSSGAMIQNIVDRAKKAAIKEALRSGQKGLRLDYLLNACAEEFKGNEDLPNTSNPDDWARISGKKGEPIAYVKSISHFSEVSDPVKPTENVKITTPGQYL